MRSQFVRNIAFFPHIRNRRHNTKKPVRLVESKILRIRLFVLRLLISLALEPDWHRRIAAAWISSRRSYAPSIHHKPLQVCSISVCSRRHCEKFTKKKRNRFAAGRLCAKKCIVCMRLFTPEIKYAKAQGGLMLTQAPILDLSTDTQYSNMFGCERRNPWIVSIHRDARRGLLNVCVCVWFFFSTKPDCFCESDQRKKKISADF